MNAPAPSKARRDEVIDALRRGTVPARGLARHAVGLDRFGPTIDEELARASAGGGVFKCIRGEWGSGKTFASRWIADRARRAGFVTSEIQISETETPLHRLETVYRRIPQSLRTSSMPASAFRPILDSWLFTLESDAVAADPSLEYANEASITTAVESLLERRLASVSSRTPVFAQALRGYRTAVISGDGATAYADAVAVYLGLGVSRLSNRGCTISF